MAVSNYRALQAFVAGADLSAAYATGVKMGSVANTVVAATAGGCIGIVIEPAKQGMTVGVCCEQGVKCPARVSAAVPVGSAVTVGANGLFKAAASGDTILGYAEEAASAADQIITILFTFNGAVA